MRMSLMLAGMILGAVALSTPVFAAPKSPSAEVAKPTKASPAKRKRRTRAVQQPPTQIACTRYGCNPIPPGCRIETEYNMRTWNPSGFDAVVCAPR